MYDILEKEENKKWKQSLDKERNICICVFSIIIIALIATCLIDFDMIAPVLIFGCIFAFLDILFLLAYLSGNSSYKKMEELNQKGKLIKKYPCLLQKLGDNHDNKQVYRLYLNYTSPSGQTISYNGNKVLIFTNNDNILDPYHNKGEDKEEGTIDLLVDESNPQNHYIADSINRLNGNLPEDFYKTDTIEKE